MRTRQLALPGASRIHRPRSLTQRCGPVSPPDLISHESKQAPRPCLTRRPHLSYGSCRVQRKPSVRARPKSKRQRHWRTNVGKRKTESAQLSKFEVSLFGLLKGTWVPDREERDASWELYIEIITRDVYRDSIRTTSIRETLNSLYSLFQEIRAILRKYGPSIVQAIDDRHLSFGEIAVTVINRILRPLLSKWHQTLLAYENTRQTGSSLLSHEGTWDKYQEIKDDIDIVKTQLIAYADLLADASGVKPIHKQLN